jgi:putative transport protein
MSFAMVRRHQGETQLDPETFFRSIRLKMNPLILLGACSGAGTMTAALRAIQDEAQSKLPALGYTVPYAVGNIVLTAWGPVIVA